MVDVFSDREPNLDEFRADMGSASETRWHSVSLAVEDVMAGDFGGR